MLKLKKVILDLHSSDYDLLEESLVKNKADNFLFLLKTYRKESTTDKEIISLLNINANAFYVLKSRLYDKVQSFLSGNIHADKEDVVKTLQQVAELCYTNSRETAIAMLEKLEKDLLYFDMHHELLVVYSALKKLNLFSQKYFHYSQLYNKHIAFGLSLEKCEEILGNFSRLLGQYNFSRSQKLRDTILFIRKDIDDHYNLNKSRQIEIIRNFIEIQIALFCHTELNKEINIEEKLNQTQKQINDLPQSSPSKMLATSLDFLFFEYYFRAGQIKSARPYYEQLNANVGALLLQTDVCPNSFFLISRLNFEQQNGAIEHLKDETLNLLFDPEDTHSKVIIGIYQAMMAFYRGKYKESASKLNEILNINSFKDYFHVNTEVKLSLAYIYLQMEEYDMADNLLKNIYRKIKSENLEQYQNVLNLIKVFNVHIKDMANKVSAKQRDHFALFMARNINESNMLNHLVNELKRKYA